MIDTSKVVLKTHRAILCSFKEDDLYDLYAYASEDGVGEMAGWPHHRTLEDSRFFLRHYIEDHNTFAIKIDGHVFGSISIGDIQFKLKDEDKDKSHVEVGYVLAKDLWGKGIMTEVLYEVIKWLFTSRHIDLIFSGNFKRNTRSKRVQEKCGLKHYLYQSYKTKIGTYEDEEIMCIRKEDIIYITDGLSLIPYYEAYDTTLKWYEDKDLVKNIDNRDGIYTLDLLKKMYDYLDNNGFLFYIHYDNKIIGDITLLDNGEIAIAISRPYQDKHIGRSCVKALIAKARTLGYSEVKMRIYPFNIQSQKMALACGFKRVDDERYVLNI